MKIILLALPLILMVAGGPDVQAQQTKVENMPGYVNLEGIEIPADAEDFTDLDLGPDLLKAALGTSEEDDSKLAEALSKIKSVRVKAFSLDEESSAQVISVMESLEKKLEAEKWDRAVYVQSGDERFMLYIKHEDEKVAGLMMMAMEPDDEAVFANIVGQLDLATAFALVNEVGDVDLDEIMEELEDNDDDE